MARVTLVALCLVAFIAAAHCRSIRSIADGDEYFFFQLENGTIIRDTLIGSPVGTKAFNAKNVGLYLYTKKTGKDAPEKVTGDTCADWTNGGFDGKKRTVVLAHGYTNGYDSESVQVIKNAYLEKKDHNILIIDYKAMSSPYLTAVSNAKQIGQTVAKIVTFARDSCGLNLGTLECVGHSLGSHVCGLFSAALPQKAVRIHALDPAAPVIGAYGDAGRLDISDSPLLQCLHTSSDGLAITKAFCHVDFYPNGAKDQFGCDPSSAGQALAGGCDHAKACTLFADSILHPNVFPATCQCDTADKALSKTCSKYEVVTHMGESYDGKAQGIFYINTHPILEALYA